MQGTNARSKGGDIANHSCRICQHAPVKSVGTVKPYRELSFPVFECTACGCRFTESSEEVFDALHSGGDSTYAVHTVNARKAYGFVRKKDRIGFRAWIGGSNKFRFVLDAVERFPLSARVLEVGCSRGALTAYLRLAGYDARGTDISPAVLDAASALFGPHFVSTDTALRDDQSYDVILHTGTVGCVEDPVGFTQTLIDRLRPGGALVFNAPNVTYAHRLKQPWPYSTPPPDLTAAFPASFWDRFASDQIRVDVEERTTPMLQAVQRVAEEKLQGPLRATPFSPARRAANPSLPARVVQRVIALESRVRGVLPDLPEEFGQMVTLRRRQRPSRARGRQKWAIIGTGVVATRHAQAVAELHDVATLSAIVEPDAGRRAAFASAHRPDRVFADVAALAASGDVDVVSIATPPHTHVPIIKTVLEEMAPHVGVLCEKPIAPTLEAADALAALTDDQHRRLGFIYQLRYSADHQRARAVARWGGMGELLSATVVRTELVSRPPPSNDWWGTFDKGGGGTLMQQLVHELDMLLQMFGPARSVRASLHTMAYAIDAEDTVVADIGFSGGRAVVTLLPTGTAFRRSVEFHGRDAAVRIPFDVDALPERRAALRRAAAQIQTAVVVPRVTRAVDKVRRRLGYARVVEQPRSPHAQLFSDAIIALDCGASMPVTFSDARASLELAAAIYKAAVTETRVTLPVAPDDPYYGGVDLEAYRALAGPSEKAEK